MKFPKSKRYRDATYLSYVRDHPCCSCNASGPSEAHHFMRGAGGLGMKVDDTHTVPLCRNCHAYWHTRGVLPCFRMYEREHWKSELFMYQVEAQLLGLWLQRTEDSTSSDVPEGVF